MSEIRVEASALVPASPPVVYGILADYHEGHPSVLPRPPFGALTVEQGGRGAGTVIRVEMTSFGQRRTLVGDVTEPEPGRRLVEAYRGTDMVTTFTVDPSAGGCRLTIETTWSTPGLRGWIERWLAPPFLRKVYQAELDLIAQAAARRGGPASGGGAS